MKNIIKTLMLSLFVAVAVSCENDDKTSITSPTEPVLLNPATGSSYVLMIEDESKIAETFVWNHAEYGIQTAVNYEIEFAAAGTDFATVLESTISQTNQKFTSVTVKQLNEMALAAGIAAFTEGQLDVRVKAWLGESDAEAVYSNSVAIKVTPYVLVVPDLFMVGNVQGSYGLNEWTPTTAMKMRHIGGTKRVYEAYVKVGVGQGLKFIGNQADWGSVVGNYGLINNADDGNLQNDGGSNDLKIAETNGSGLYYIQVDIDNLKYKYVKMNWGIIGDSTPGGWGGETAMTYDFASNSFNIATTLTAGELKFRARNASQAIYGEDWKFNVANTDPKTAYDTNGPNFGVTAGARNLVLAIGFDGIATVTGL